MSSAWPDRSKLPSADDPARASQRAIRCLPGEVAPHVLVPGDPVRAHKIATDYLTDAKLVMVQREFHTYTGHYRDVPVSVVSTGVGAPGACMVVQDLAKLGCDVVIRVGTAGSCHTEVKPGDNVIGLAAVRDEGLTHKFLPPMYPAAAHFSVTRSLVEQNAKHPVDSHVGIVHTSDAFSSPALKQDIETGQYAGVLAIEMEASAVLMTSAIEGLRAGCIFSIDGYVANVAEGNTVPDKQARNRGIQVAINTALESIVSLSQS
ncbi:MAG: nucleoside phosphorylase [Pseudomonadota bacterium]